MATSIRSVLLAAIVMAVMAMPARAVEPVADADSCQGLNDFLNDLLNKGKKEQPAPGEEPAPAPDQPPPVGGEGVADAQRIADEGAPYEEHPEEDRHRIRLISPTAQTRWEHGERNVQWQWDPSTANGKVRFELWRGRKRVAQVRPPVENDGKSGLTDPVFDGWGAGRNFYLVAVDSKGRVGVSEPFMVYGGILVTYPYEATVWQAGDKSTYVAWDTGTVKGDKVKFEVWKGDKMLVEYHPMTGNDGQEKRAGAIPEDWAAGDDYRIRAVDAKGRSGFSERFRVNNGPTVLYPDAQTVWTYPATDQTIRWDPASVRGDKVRFEVWKGDKMVGELLKNQDNTGTAMRGKAIEPAWGQGDDYRIKAIDGKGKEGFSAKFTIKAEIIVTKPDHRTTYVMGDKTVTATWKPSSASGEVRFELWSADQATKIADYMGPVKNDGRSTREGGFDLKVPAGEYRLKAIDTNGFTGWSEVFNVKAPKG